MNKRGQALIEFVLIVPVILLVLVSLVDIGNIFLKKYNLTNTLETISQMYEAGKEKEAKAYAALEDVEISESRTDDMIKISISKDIDISAPVMNKILGKTYTIKDEKTIYIGDENEQ